jgi:uncharacterized protein with PIN domain
MSMKDEMRQHGYSKEDEYFFTKDQELIEKMRIEADAQHKEIEGKNKELGHWMKCPKCGSELEEEKYVERVLFDRCPGCGGIYLDKGELEILLKGNPEAFRGLSRQ